jgi:hypothetical protein
VMRGTWEMVEGMGSSSVAGGRVVGIRVAVVVGDAVGGTGVGVGGIGVAVGGTGVGVGGISVAVGGTGPSTALRTGVEVAATGWGVGVASTLVRVAGAGLGAQAVRGRMIPSVPSKSHSLFPLIVEPPFDRRMNFGHHLKGGIKPTLSTTPIKIRTNAAALFSLFFVHSMPAPESK